MQRILRKRIFRDLRENLFRYLALGFLIILGMYMIVSIVGAADTIILGVAEKGEKNHLEDGEFQVFVPLGEKEIRQLTEDGITLEQMFYLDFYQEDGSTLRVYRNRENINLLELEEGHLAEAENEVVLEKRYCEEKEICAGDRIQIGEESYQVVGIGTVPDYDAPYKSLSDSSVDSKNFGLAFLTQEAYARLKTNEKSVKAEEFIYAYLLNGQLTDDELREQLKELELEPERVEDPYFREYWDETAGKKEELSDGIEELLDGSKDLQEALEDLGAYQDDLQEGAGAVLEAYIKEANDALAAYGLSQTLTEENFSQTLKGFRENSGNGLLNLKVYNLEQQLKELKAYKDGIISYTDGVAQIEEGSRELVDGMQELSDGTDELLEKYMKVDIGNLIQFLPVEDNPRVGASGDDQIINRQVGLAAGVIVMVLFTYVISVFVIHGIEKESSMIGTLYALGVKRSELICHYLMLPVFITFVSGVIGTAIGYSSWGVRVQMGDCYSYYSVPVLDTVYEPYLLVYGIVMPPVVAAIVNYFVIRKRLSWPALCLIRNEQKKSRVSNVNLGDMRFIGRFRIRQMLREIRTGFTVWFGMFISMLIMMLGINCYVLCSHISTDNKADTRYAYMYTYKYPEKEVPEGGEACYGVTLKKEIYGYNLDITVLGIDEDNPYFEVETVPGKSKVVASSAMAQKGGLSVGDKLILTDEEAERDYAFTVEDIAQFSPGLYVFMDIDSMRELFGAEEDYYNIVFSGEALEIEAGRLYGITSREDISKSSDVFVSLMMPMVIMMTLMSALIFGIVMYLMMKVMIDRSAFGISLMKIFGYRTKEIRRLYLNGNFYTIAVGAALCLPLSKAIMDAMYPYMIANVACGMDLTFSWQLYAGIYAAIILLYFLIDQLLVRRLKKLVPAEVLKNRE